MSLKPMRVPILMYHKIAQPAKNSLVQSHYVPPDLFAKQMRALQRLGYQSVPVTSIFEGPENLRRAVITFDDGYENFLENALPVLTKLGQRSTVYLVANQIGGTNAWDVALGDVEERLMSQAQIQKAYEAGTEFGSHTLDHSRLSEVSEEEATDQIFGSRSHLEQLLRIPIDSFCYPYGARTQRVEKLVESAGYKMACSTAKGVNDSSTNPFALKRINIRRETSVPVFLYKLWRGNAFGK